MPTRSMPLWLVVTNQRAMLYDDGRNSCHKADNDFSVILYCMIFKTRRKVIW